MKTNFIKLSGNYLSFAVLALVFSLSSWSCAEKKAVAAQNPKGYDLENPKRYSMPDILQEISGIAFNKGDSSVVYAQQDEDGILFSLPLGTKDDKATKFGKKGDYEDVAVAQGWAILLKSNGTFYTFPLTETSKEEVENAIETKDLIPKGEYEGMFANETTGEVYVLCKNCKVDKDTKKTSGYILSLQTDGSLKSKGTFQIDVSKIDKMSGKKKGTFHPSALATNPITKQWFIVSSVNKVLLVADEKFNIISTHHLSSNTFNQPEGIAFDKDGNLFISNEGSETQTGNILRFDYKKP